MSKVNVHGTLAPITNAVQVIDVAKTNILKGRAFKAVILFSLDAGDVRYLAFETPSDIDIVWGVDKVKADVNYVKYQLLENVVFTGGDLYPVIAINRQSAIVAKNKLYATPTGVDIGAAVELDLDATLGAQGLGATPGPGGEGEQVEFTLLKRSTKYVLRLENMDDANATTVLVKSQWIEAELQI